MKKIIFLLLLCLFFASFVTADRLYTWGKTENIWLNTETKTLHSFDGFDFVYNDKGYFDVWKSGEHQGRLSFGVFGTLNSNPEKRLMSDFDWTWQVIENTPEKISVRATNNYAPFPWTMDLNVQKYAHLKITHSLTNNTGFDLENAQFFYLIDANQTTNPYIYYDDKNNMTHAYDYSTNYHFSQADTNFEEYYNNVHLGNFQFLFDDIINDNFFITRTFFGNLSQLDEKLPNTNGFVVGFSKGTQILTSGQRIIIDPTLTTKSDNFDAYIEFLDGSYSSVSGSLLAGVASNVAHYWWYRSFLEFDLTGLSYVSDANFHLFLRNSIVSGMTCNFDLNSVPTIGAGIDQTDWDTTPFYKEIDNWFDETLDANLTGLVTTSWNQAISNGRNYLTLRIAADDDLAFTETSDNDCYKSFCDTGDVTGFCSDGVIENPYIEYTSANLDINLTSFSKFDSNSYLQGNKIFIVDFNTHSQDFNAVDLLFDINYNTSQALGGWTIIDDGNVASTPNFFCDSNDLAEAGIDYVPCHYVWTTPTIFDGNAFLVIKNDLNTVFSNPSFYLDNNTPIAYCKDCNNRWQLDDTNIHLGCDETSLNADLNWRIDTNFLSGVNMADWNTTFGSDKNAFELNVLFTNDGNWQIEWQCVDRSGRVSDTNTIHVYKDTTPATVSSYVPDANTTTSDSKPISIVNVNDLLQTTIYCDYNYWYNDTLTSNGTVTAISGVCSHQSNALATGDFSRWQWSVRDDANNFTGKFFTATYTFQGASSPPSGGGGGGGSTTILSLVNILFPKEDKLRFVLSPGIQQSFTITLENPSTTIGTPDYNVSPAISEFVFLPENISLPADTNYSFDVNILVPADYNLQEPRITKTGFITFQTEGGTSKIEIELIIINQALPLPFQIFFDFLKTNPLIGYGSLIITIVLSFGSLIYINAKPVPASIGFISFAIIAFIIGGALFLG